MEELNAWMQAYVQQQNEKSLSDFDGLSSFEMYQLLYAPFSAEAPIVWHQKPDLKTLHESPMFNVVHALLSMIWHEKGIKLTAIGNLNRKAITEIYAKGDLPDYFIETGITALHSESDWPVIHNVKQVLLLTPLVKKSKNKLLLTKQGQKYLEKERWDNIFKDFFVAYATRFNWAYNDGFKDERLGQLGAFYLFYLLHKYGDIEREIHFYTALYFKAFPQLSFDVPESYHSPPQWIVFVRFFERFAHRFGLVSFDKETNLREEPLVLKTPLLSMLMSRR